MTRSISPELAARPAERQTARIVKRLTADTARIAKRLTAETQRAGRPPRPTDRPKGRQADRANRKAVSR